MNRIRSRVVAHGLLASSAIASVLLALVVTACGGAGAAGAASPEPAIAEAWRAKCGNCHRRVEPGTRARPELEAALARHRGRVRLSEEQWSALTDFLAPKPASSAAPSSSAN